MLDDHYHAGVERGTVEAGFSQAIHGPRRSGYASLQQRASGEGHACFLVDLLLTDCCRFLLPWRHINTGLVARRIQTYPLNSWRGVSSLIGLSLCEDEDVDRPACFSRSP